MKETSQNIFIQLGRNLKDRFSGNDEHSTDRMFYAASNFFGGLGGNLVNGTFLTGLLLIMGADDAFMGMLAMMGSAGNIAQMFAPLLLERFERRKKIILMGMFMVFICYGVLITVTPFMPLPKNVRLMSIAFIVLILNVINGMIAPGLQVWTIQCIPEWVRARFFSFITIVSTILGYSELLLASKFTDYYKHIGRELDGLVILRWVGFAFYMVSFIALLKLREQPVKSSGNKVDIVSFLTTPFKGGPYLITVLMSCLWQVGMGIAGPYYTVFLLKDLKLDYSYITLVSMLNVPVIILFTPLWKKAIEATSWFKTLCIAMGINTLSYLGLAFVSHKTLILYPVFSVLSFIVMAAVNLIAANMMYINLPEKNQTNFVSFYMTMATVASLAGTVLGREFIKNSADLSVTILGVGMGNKQLLYIIAAAIFLFAAFVGYFLTKDIEKPADEKKSQVIEANA